MERGVTIENMRLTGHTAVRGRLLDALETQDWPDAASRRVMVVRRLEVSGHWWEIPAQAARQSRDRAHAAVPADSPNADLAAAVFFESPGELLALQCRDILSANVERWFWQSWPGMRQEPSAALTDVLRDSLEWLPEALERWSAKGLADRLLGNLPVETLDRLVDQIGARFGRNLRHSTAEIMADPMGAGSPAAGLMKRLRHALVAWRAVLTRVTGPKRTASARLVLTVVAWQRVPALLCRPDAAQCLEGLLAEQVGLRESPGQLSARGSSSARDTAGSGDDDADSALPVGLANEVPEAAGPASAGLADIPSNTGERRRSGTGQVDRAGTPIREDAMAGGSGVKAASSAPQPDAPAERSGSAPAWQFLTLTGRSFFLINTLRAAGLEERLIRGEIDPWNTLWRLLARLELPVDPAARAFLADRMGLPDVEALDHVAPLPDEHAILEGLQRRFAVHRFWHESDWTYAPARVLASSTHLDLHFDTSAVRDDIRLAGLDVDPGWLPWLGAVVRIHYDVRPELRAASAGESRNE